jgi:predicted N-acyltransferase
LEDAGTLGERTGWIPRFPIVRRGTRIIAAAPSYVKSHSMGEFVFDWGWAEAAERIGIAYYPKLLIGVPFTPVTGRRLLTAPSEDRAPLLRMLARLLIQVAELMELSSVHVNFATEEELTALEAEGFLRREGIQYHWFRRGESTFDDYLARFNSKQRNQIKRERREVERQDVIISIEPGEKIEPREAFELYKTTIDKFYWGRQYLNRKVFELWKERMPERIQLVAARREGSMVAGAFNFIKGKRLYGRYWGAFEEIPHLHFNVCYYTGIEQCFACGLDVFEPGAGGEHKLSRGFEPTVQLSAHWIRDRRFREMLRLHLAQERR